MGKYFKLQIKRFMRLIPFVLIIALVLFLGLAVVFNGIMQLEEADGKNKVFRVAVTGDTDNKLFGLGLAAIQTFDSSRFTLEMVEVDEKTAKDMLIRGEVSAYAVFPDGFMEAALYGKILKIKFVTNSQADGMVAVVKDELARAVEQLVFDAQKGTFSLDAVLRDNGYESLAYEHTNNMSIEYVDVIVARNNTYKADILGLDGGVSFAQYLFCGISVLFLFLIGLSFVSVLIQKDTSFGKMLAFGGVSPFKQTVCEFSAFFITGTLMCAVAFVAVHIGAAFIPQSFFEGLGVQNVWSVFIIMLPVIALACAFNIMIFQIAGDVISGVLIQFFATVSLCYVSGCFYPVKSLPVVLQSIADYLPTGAARGFLCNGIATENYTADLIITLAYTFVFLGLAATVKHFKIQDRGTNK